MLKNNALKNTFSLLFFLFTYCIYSQSNCDINCPEDSTVAANESNEYVVPDYFADGLVTLETDECDASAEVTQSPAPGTVVGLGEFEVIMTVESLGETDTCDFDVTVVEEVGSGEDCDFDCPEDQVGNTDADGNYTIPNYVTNGALVITGDCGDFASSQTPEAGTVVGEGTTTISLTADTGTSSISCTFNLTVGASTLSTTEFTELQLSVYPNPTTSKINISEMVDILEVFSLTGKRVFKSTKVKSVNINRLNSGLYILKITHRGVVDLRRLVKN